MHAAAVGTPAGGVLLAGRSGSGKSTSSLACLTSDLRYAGDDYVLVRVEPTPVVYNLYGTAKLEPESARRFPAVAHAIEPASPSDGDKTVFFLHERYADRLISGFPIRAVLIPQVTGRRDTRLRPATPVAALTALAPTTLFQLPGGSREGFRKMSHLVRQVATYTLEVGTDLVQIPATISALLAATPSSVA